MIQKRYRIACAMVVLLLAVANHSLPAQDSKIPPKAGSPPTPAKTMRQNSESSAHQQAQGKDATQRNNVAERPPDPVTEILRLQSFGSRLSGHRKDQSASLWLWLFVLALAIVSLLLIRPLAEEYLSRWTLSLWRKMRRQRR